MIKTKAAATKTIVTGIHEVKKTLNEIKACYAKKIKPETPPEAAERIRTRIRHLSIAVEAAGVFEPLELQDNKCKICGREFSGDEISGGEFYYCPKCGQALIDWLDDDIEDDIEDDITNDISADVSKEQ